MGATEHLRSVRIRQQYVYSNTSFVDNLFSVRDGLPDLQVPLAPSRPLTPAQPEDHLPAQALSRVFQIPVALSYLTYLPVA